MSDHQQTSTWTKLGFIFGLFAMAVSITTFALLPKDEADPPPVVHQEIVVVDVPMVKKPATTQELIAKLKQACYRHEPTEQWYSELVARGWEAVPDEISALFRSMEDPRPGQLSGRLLFEFSLRALLVDRNGDYGRQALDRAIASSSSPAVLQLAIEMVQNSMFQCLKECESRAKAYFNCDSMVETILRRAIQIAMSCRIFRGNGGRCGVEGNYFQLVEHMYRHCPDQRHPSEVLLKIYLENRDPISGLATN